MQVRKNVLTLAMIAILTLVPLSQAGLGVTAAPQAVAAPIPYLMTTIQNVGATPTGIAVDEVHNYIYVASMGGSHLTRINGADWAIAYSATSGVVYKPMGLAVNPADQRVYACNSSPHLSIVDGNSLGLVHAVDMGTGNAQMDVALNPSLGYAFATDFDHDRAYAVDMGSYAKSNINNLAPGGTKIALSSDGKAAYVTCYSSNSVDVIDTARRELVARYFGHYNLPVGIAVNPLNGYIYVANAGNGTVTVVDDRNALKWTISVGGTVKGVAYNPNSNRIFVTQNGTPGHVYVYDGTTYGHVTTLQLHNNPDAYIAVDKTRNRVYVTNQGSGNVSVIQDADTATTAAIPPDTPAAEPPAPRPDEPSPITCPYWITNTVVGTGPQGIAVDDAHHVAYVANGTASTISRVSLDTNLEEATSGTGLVAGPTAVAVNATTQIVYVANGSSTSITVFDGTSLLSIGYVSLLQKPKHIYLATDIYRAYVANHSDDLNTNYVSEIDAPPPPGIATKLRDIEVGKGPYAVALSSDRAIAYVTCHDSIAYGGSYLSIIDVNQGKEVGQFFTHYNQPTDIVVDPAWDRIYVANEGGSGTVVAVDRRNLLKRSADLGGRPRGLALNPAFHRLAVIQKDSSAVSFLDTSSFTQGCVPIFTMGADRWIAFSALYNRFYASLSGGNTVAVVQDYVGDGYENDDSYALAHLILNDTPQVHSIDPAGDVDWVKVIVSQPMTLTLGTTDTYSTVYTTTLSLYDTNGTTALVTDTNPIVYHFATNGTYYLKVNATDADVGDAGYTYELLFTGGLPTYRIYLPLLLRGED